MARARTSCVSWTPQVANTFGQLNTRSDVIARSLGKYKRVGMSMRPSTELIVTLVSMVSRGVPDVPLDPALPGGRLRFIEDSAVDCVIHGSHVEPPTNTESPWMAFSALMQNFDDEEQTSDAVHNENSTFCIFYTSGSCGMAKGVQLPVRAVINRLLWQWESFPFTQDDVLCIKTQIGFVDSIAELWAPLLKAKPIVIVPKHFLANPSWLMSEIAIYRIRRITLVPHFLA